MKKILIIAIDPILTKLYQVHLEKADFEVAVTFDGETGLCWIEKYRPDGVLLDLMMPKTNGTEILAQIRAQPRNRAIRVIAFADALGPALIDQARSAGATRLFNKAILTPRMLIETFRAIISEPTSAPQGDSDFAWSQVTHGDSLEPFAAEACGAPSQHHTGALRKILIMKALAFCYRRC